MSDVQALASESDAKPQPLKTFGNTNRFFVVPMLLGAKIKYNFQTRKKNNEKMQQPRDVYMNRIQQRMFFAGARNVALLAARRFGKTDGGIGPRMWAVAGSMPRGAGAFLGSSRKQLFARTIPAAIAAQERFYQLREGVHFGWGRPPKGVETCIIRPKSYDNCMWYANGWLWHTISLSVFGSANGLTLNSLIADECKFLPKKKIDEEVMPALSGMVHPMGSASFSEHNPYYKSTFFCSDAALSSKNNWLEQEEKKLDLTIDSGPFEGKTYRDIQTELDQYADDVMFFNEMLRGAKRDGHRVIVVSDEEKTATETMAQQVMAHEGPYKILPNWGKQINKATCDYLVSYKLITPEQAELLFNHEYLLTKEQHFQMMMIRGSKKYQEHINQLRCQAFYFVRASSLDNIDILGEDYIRRMKRDLPPLVFLVSILNQKPAKTGEGFYYAFDPDIHCYIEDDCPAIDQSITVKKGSVITGGTAFGMEYESPDFGYLGNLKDCTLDGDVVDDQPLHVAFDAGKIVNWIVTGQMYKRDGRECLNVLSSMFVKDGLMLQHLIKQWSDYYAPHRKKCNVVHFYYDHTFLFKPTGVYVDDIKDTIIKEMRKRGWEVNAIPIGKTWPHYQRYKDIGEGMSEFSYPCLRINRENNEALILALENCGTRLSYAGENTHLRKDKAGEKLMVDSERATPGAVPEELRTDGTDAFDTLYIGVRHYRNSMPAMCLPSGR